MLVLQQLFQRYSLNTLSTISDIIAYGSNSNGSYIKYANGVLICYGNYDTGNLTGWDTWGGLYVKSISFGDFPHQFIAPPVILKTIQRGYSGWIFNDSDSSSSTSWGPVAIMRPTSGEDTYYKISLLAIGRWK